MNKTRARPRRTAGPYVVIVIENERVADLDEASPKSGGLCHPPSAEIARVGIHLVVARRASADVITGMIKGQHPFPHRICCCRANRFPGHLDVNGAGHSLGMATCFSSRWAPVTSSACRGRTSPREIAVLVNHWRHQAEPEFREELLRRPLRPRRVKDDLFDPDSDDAAGRCRAVGHRDGERLVSMLQRRRG